jgi:DNA-binding transcriptional LysR family regulator
MRLSIYSLQLFVAVVEEGTIAAAAERENIAASALSKRISELERLVGTPLLLRKARGVEPTAAGQILVRGARTLLHQADDVAAEVRNFATGESGHVRVAANLSSITQFLAQDIASFNAGHPNIQIDLEERVSAVVTRMVLDNVADIGVFNASDDESRLVVVPYREDRMVLVAPAGHALAGRSQVAFEETLDHEHVGMHRGSAANDMLLRAANAFDRPLRMRFFVTSYDAMIAMVKAGLGIGLIPQKSIALYDAGELSVIALIDPWARRKLKLCVRPGDTMSAAAQMLLAHLRASDESH